MSDDPAIFLRQPPTPEGRDLTEIIPGQHTGSAVPFWMFSEVCVRQAKHGRWIGSMSGMYAKVRKHVKAGLVLLLANLGLIGGYAWHLASETGAAAERASSQQTLDRVRREWIDETLRRLQHEIDELRADLRRLSGVEPDKSGTDIIVDPDKYSSLLARPETLLAAPVPLPRPEPGSLCGSSCNSNIQCSFDRSCPFCNFGTCKSTRPEAPIVDAGVDAPGGTTQ